LSAGTLRIQSSIFERFYECVFDKDAKAVLFKLLITWRGIIADRKTGRQRRPSRVVVKFPLDDSNSGLGLAPVNLLVALRISAALLVTVSI